MGCSNRWRKVNTNITNNDRDKKFNPCPVELDNGS